VSRNDSTDGRVGANSFGRLRRDRERRVRINSHLQRFQLRYGWREIIAAGGGTLSATYLHLTGKRSGWEDFRATRRQETVHGSTGSPRTVFGPRPFMNAHFSPGRKYRLRTDKPFPV
jgi:hypothetical protein